MRATCEALLAEMTAQERPESQKERELEAQHVMDLLADPIISKELTDYGDATVAGVGGSGIILQAMHAPSQTERAIKLPRLPIYKKALDGESVEVDPEVAALAKISHQNITRLYHSFKIPSTDLHCVITQYVPEHSSLDAYAYALCCNDSFGNRQHHTRKPSKRRS